MASTNDGIQNKKGCYVVDITYNGTVFDTVASPFSEERAIELAKKKVDQDGLDWLGVDFLL